MVPKLRIFTRSIILLKFQFLLTVKSLLLLSGFPVTAAWELESSKHFRVYYREGTDAPAQILEIAETFYTEMRRLTSRIPAGRIDIWVCDTPSDFQKSVHAPIQDWAVGCAFPLSRRIVLQNPTQISFKQLQLSQVLRHEIAHVLFGQYTQKSVREIPLWFIEGIAIHFSKEWVPSRSETLLKHIFSKSILPLGALSEQFPSSPEGAELAYAESQDALRWLVEFHGSETLWLLIDRLHAGEDFGISFETVVGSDIATYDKLWQESLRERYHWAALFSNSYLLWGGLGGLALLGYLISWNRRRLHLKKLAQKEETVDALFKP